MKFLFDMGMPYRSAQHLESLGHVVVHLRSEGLQRLPDREIVRKALAEEYVIVTHDLDFGELVAKAGRKLPSVVTFRLRDMRHGSVNRYLDLIVRGHLDALETGVAVTVTETRIRIRKLPVEGS